MSWSTGDMKGCFGEDFDLEGPSFLKETSENFG
jgi:hypothetical protein